MKTLKYSRQREAIKAYLASTKRHPTADVVYSHVQEEFPHISLGTVYRNLNLLAELGEIRKITTPDGADRFDGDVSQHYHVICSECGKIFDLDMKMQDSLNQLADHSFSGTIHSHTALFYGICEECEKTPAQKQ